MFLRNSAIVRMKQVMFTMDYIVEKQCRMGWSLQRRLINRHYLVFITKGRLELCIDREKLLLQAGNYALLIPGNVAEARAPLSEAPEVVLLAFSYVEAQTPHNRSDDKEPEHSNPMDAPLIESHSGRLLSYGHSVLHGLKQLKAAGEERDAMGGWKQQVLLQQLLFTLAYETHRSVQAQGGMRETILQLAAYLDEHYMQPDLSLQALAETYGISWSNFSGTFKKYVGVRPIDYLTQLRMNHAKSRLLLPLRMEEVAQQVGYRDPLYFSRTFKKTVGISPTVYRKNRERENIITLSPHVNDYLLALELLPFATIPYAGNDQLDGRLPYIADKLKDTRILRKGPHPDLEALIKANPRMILGQIGSMDSPAPLDNIAPTVKLLLRDDWRSLLLELSEMFGRRAQYTRWVRYFEQKAAKARKSLSQKLKREETVMVLIASNNDLRVYGGRRQLGEILYRELKLHPPQGITLQDHYTCVTPEQLGLYEPDHIFLATTNSNLHRAQVRELMESEAWRKLSAVRRGNVYEVQSWLNGHAPIQHSLSIDIVLHHLLKGSV